MKLEVTFNDKLLEVSATLVDGGKLDIDYVYDLEKASYIDYLEWNNKTIVRFEREIVSELSGYGADEEYDFCGDF